MSASEPRKFRSLKLPKTLDDKVARLADLNGRSVSAEIRIALETYVKAAKSGAA